MHLYTLFLACAAGWFGSATPLPAGGTGVPAGRSTQRNVVLLIADDLGFQLGCYGDTIIRTPNIDGLAKNGVRFTNAFAASYVILQTPS